ncbi:hypothetical protein SODALDRAFT_334017 [Sodiomyces alkalinus F11]|uniref:Uncharacterized protein n=1 Tax=Sodiomyces alkalinus (strain CBS 110278 / VKM F-3762 / F11) TaxID=1314773 RepID=A0A3N2PUS5_SODAK|nr:hypothetical protein SODALDRAFT_334017 [Sodiomyces alkalinus F11]ROT38255.1 hypothetical protein SODALDRAFT_334017 [Sodiomyces alkalinus F11]
MRNYLYLAFVSALIAAHGALAQDGTLYEIINGIRLLDGQASSDKAKYWKATEEEIYDRPRTWDPEKEEPVPLKRPYEGSENTDWSRRRGGVDPA